VVGCFAWALGGFVRRREFIKGIIGSATTWPLVARAQQAALPVIGFLFASTTQGLAAQLPGFHRGLADTGFVEGRNVAIEYRIAEGHLERLPEFAADLVRRGVDLIFAGGGDLPAKAAEAATKTIPIVFTTGVDAVTAGLVASLNHPGGNATGINILVTALVPKRIELLHAMVPQAATLGLLFNPKQPEGGGEEAVRRLGLEPYVVHAAAESELDAAFASLKERKVGAVLIGTDPAISGWYLSTIALAARHRLPAMYQQRREVVNGGLMSYGPDLVDVYHQAGTYAGRILKGEKPADLPVQQPTKFEFVINMKTAKALGLTVPASMQLLADELIE
jgi:putative ABC transport system substrate-binding protein